MNLPDQLSAAVRVIIAAAPETARDGGKLLRVIAQNPNNSLIARRLGILYYNATADPSNVFTPEDKRIIGEALLAADSGRPYDVGDGLTERFEMKMSPEQKAWVLDNGGAAKVRELIDRERGGA